MKPIVVASIALTALCWGIYGPVLHWGQAEMGMSRLRAFLCVGLAYFVIAVIVPFALMQTMETDKAFTVKGFIWSSAAGAAGAFGALGIVLAMSNGGKPVYVMPLVFGLAPVVNSFFTIYMAGKWSEVSPMFLSGLILVGMGAAMVLFFAPSSGPAHAAPAKAAEKAAQEESSSGKSEGDASNEPAKKQ